MGSVHIRDTEVRVLQNKVIYVSQLVPESSAHLHILLAKETMKALLSLLSPISIKISTLRCKCWGKGKDDLGQHSKFCWTFIAGSQVSSSVQWNHIFLAQQQWPMMIPAINFKTCRKLVFNLLIQIIMILGRLCHNFELVNPLNLYKWLYCTGLHCGSCSKADQVLELFL